MRKHRIPARADENVLRWTRKTRSEDKVFPTERPVFNRSRLNQLLVERERRAGDRLEKGWVHAIQLGWLRHYRARQRKG